MCRGIIRKHETETRARRGGIDGEGAQGTRIVGITVLSHRCGHPVNTVEAGYRYRLPRRAHRLPMPAVIRRLRRRHTVHPAAHRFDCNPLSLSLFSSALGGTLSRVCFTLPVPLASFNLTHLETSRISVSRSTHVIYYTFDTYKINDLFYRLSLLRFFNLIYLKFFYQ